MIIKIWSCNETVVYASGELQKYLNTMDYKVCTDIISSEKTEKCFEDGVIKLGLLEDFSLNCDDVNDKMIDDVVDINIKNGSGYIAGSNERSILIGVYKYLKSAGCRFLRPGEGGEYIPECDIMSHSFIYRKKADHPFRGECSEGAISYEHMRDTVYWLPKIGMNMYMIEGLVPYMYMHKWYGHENNLLLRQKGQVTDYSEMEKYISLLEKDIKKTGIQLHAVGHGWMFEKLGVHAHSNDEKNQLKDEDKKYLAMINGVRDLWGGSTFYTHFCYSNPEARKLLVDFCVEYAKKKPHIDFLHVWLADATNNQCECDECVKMTPSDHYVQLLNEIDEAFEKEGISMRLVFILYVDTVRPPEQLKLKNPKNFVILAAIGMHYELGYKNEEYRGEIPPFIRNQFVPPNNALRLKWHKQWKEMCDNIPSIIFEYRFYTDHYCDPGYMRVSRETYRDMKSLSSVYFQGCMSDQTHRVYMPTSLPMLIMAETLFDKDFCFEDYVNDYFTSAFGNDAQKCREYLEKLSDLFCPGNVRNGGKNGVEEQGINTAENGIPKTWINNPEVAEKTSQIPDVLSEFMPIIEKNMAIDNVCHRLSWVYLKYHSGICNYYCRIINLDASGKRTEAQQLLSELELYVSKIEMDIHPVFDLHLFIRYIRLKLGLKMQAYFQ